MKNLLLFFGALSISLIGFGQCQSSFSYTSNNGTVSFTNTSFGSNLGYSWSFGDGGNSNQMNPNHTYTNTGLYNVCLTIYSLDSLGTCQDTYCDSLYVVADSTQGTGCSADATFDVNPNGTITGTATSPAATYFYWSFFDDNGTLIHDASTNPASYNPGVGGTYTVCLTTYDSLQFLCDSLCYTVVTDSTLGTSCNADATFDVNPNGTITGTATSPMATYFYWAFFDDNGTEIHNASTNPASYNPGIPGVYTVCLTTYDSLQFLCDSVCYLVATDSTAGLNSLNQNLISVYPNPVNDVLTISSNSELIEQLTIVDLSGAVVYSEMILEEKMQINVSQLPEGMYFVHALGKEGQQLSTCKVIKR